MNNDVKETLCPSCEHALTCESRNPTREVIVARCKMCDRKIAIAMCPRVSSLALVSVYYQCHGCDPDVAQHVFDSCNELSAYTVIRVGIIMDRAGEGQDLTYLICCDDCARKGIRLGAGYAERACIDEDSFMDRELARRSR